MEIKSFIISTKTIVKTCIIFGVVWVCYKISDVIAIFFISVVLALALEPIVMYLSRFKISRGWAALITVFVFVGLFVSVLSISLIPFVKESQNLVSKIPNYLDALVHIPVLEPYKDQVIRSVGDQASKFSTNLIQVTFNAVSILFSVVLLIVLTLYLLADLNRIRYNVLKLFAKSDRKKVQRTIRSIETKLGGWLRGELFLMLCVGMFTYIGLYFMNIDYAIALAVLAGLLELIPMIGPTLSAIPAVIVGFGVSPTMGFGVLGLYILVQQLENHLLVPKIMERAVGQNPIVTLIAFLIGNSLFNLVGGILAIPITIIIFEVVKALRSQD